MKKHDWEDVLTKVMRKNKEYRFMEIVRAAAKLAGVTDPEAQGSVSWLLGTNRSEKYERTRRGVYRRIA